MRFRPRLAPLLLIGAFAAARIDAQQPIVLRDPGPGPVPRHLAAALAAPHRLYRPAATPLELPRDSVYSTSVIVLGRDAIISARVHGDVIVIGGDAFMHPGAVVDGRVIAIGGAVYESLLAFVRGGTESHRDFTYEVQATASGYALSYRVLRVHPSPVFSLPGIYGLRIPTYDRADGLSLPVGPAFSFDTGYVSVDATVTYRSDLGAFDPAVAGDIQFTRRTRAELFAGRTTLTNDDWIWSDLVNSAAVLALGLDTRNYYRADRVQATLHQLFEGTSIEFEPYLGIRIERDWPVGPDSLAVGGPWSLFGHRSRERILRPNPSAARGTISSALVGAHFEWEAQSVRATVDLLNEAAAFDVAGRHFDQTTLNAEIGFPTFGAQKFSLSTHAVNTFGGSSPAPPQRWSYLGGSGTITTLPLLSLGGDELLYVESNYFIPFAKLDLPVLGSPSITIRHMIGSAGIRKLPAFEQNLGARAALSFLRFDAVVDPARREWDFGLGLSMAR